MASIYRTILCLFMSCLAHTSHASKLLLENTPSDIKDGLTPTLTLRCSLNDTAASASVIGRRAVTQTADNMAAVSSLVMMKDGVDVASVSPVNPAHVMDGSTNVVVSGSVVAGVNGETAYIQLTISDPSRNQSGEWSCEVNAISGSGHIVTFMTSAEVTVSTPSTADILAAIRQLNNEKVALQHKGDVLEQTVANLKASGAHPNIFFSVGLTKSLNTDIDQVIVYDKIFSNIGNSFNASSGIFTCRSAGYYQFVITALNSFQERHYVTLQKNYQNVIAVYARSGTGNGEQGSNNVIVKLTPGDVVQVMAHANTHLYNSDPEEIYTTFSGQMIASV